MNRRRFLHALVRGGGLVAGLALGVAAPVVRAAGTLGRAPADLLVRIRRRTRAFDAADLGRPHDLQG